MPWMLNEGCARLSTAKGKVAAAIEASVSWRHGRAQLTWENRVPET